MRLPPSIALGTDDTSHAAALTALSALCRCIIWETAGIVLDTQLLSISFIFRETRTSSGQQHRISRRVPFGFLQEEQTKLYRRTASAFRAFGLVMMVAWS